MKIKEIFYSLQGEGYHTGRPAVFVRFCGCNLKCPFCDTDFKDGVEMTEGEIVRTVKELAPKCRFVVLTGGEPTLQLTESLIDRLHAIGCYVAMETNGTKAWPKNLDWVTVSPKVAFCGERATPFKFNPKADEVKLVYDGDESRFPSEYGKNARYKYLQPCDTGDPVRNAEIVASAIEWLKKNPDWMLSLQTQKIINVR